MRALALGSPLALALLLLPACQSMTDVLGIGPDWIAVESATGRVVTLDEMAAALAGRDVVFLGEIHDSDVGHELQVQLIERLGRGTEGAGADGTRADEVVVSLEMFERDTQGLLDDDLAGTIDEAVLLDGARPRKNYAEHYRPVVEWAREARGLGVVTMRQGPRVATWLGEEDLPAADHVWVVRR